MSIWNKVLVGLILLASLGLAYLALRTLRTHDHWETIAQTLERKIKQTEDESYDLREAQGNQEEPGIKYLELELRKLPDRDRVWQNCIPTSLAETPENGSVSVAVEVPGIGIGDILYVFEAAAVQAGGRYLGAFKAVAVEQDGFRVVLQPSMDTSDAELDRLAQSARTGDPWIMYETLPADTHEVFTHLDQDELKSLIPEDTTEYLRDGEPLSAEDLQQLGLSGRLIATSDDGKILYEDQDGRVLLEAGLDEQGRTVYVDEDGQFAYAIEKLETVDSNGQIVPDVQYLDESGEVLSDVSIVEKELTEGEGIYLRPLQDYKVLLENSNRQRTVLIHQIQNSEDGLASIKNALADAQRQLDLRTSEKERLEDEYRKLQFQYQAVHTLLEKLQDEVAGYQEAIDELIIENMAVAAEIDARQLDAKQRIDARTEAVVQSPAGY